ncbi:MAG TPA: MerR family transcriptional regulator [Gaiellaceae bacterium]|jgi:DNA-binding transcriptional MerR regulator|nr:MerR family transcriptional regulator [Gaiellaceae bacterium]
MSAATQAPRAERLLHIGAVCRQLQDEFPDVSISKIRYLEEQGLLKPKRTKGRYRLFDDDDVERLRTILRLQRDEFLPLRVIRQELAAPGAGKTKRKRRASSLARPEEEIDARELCERSGATPALVRELEEYGLLEPRADGREKRYAAGEADIAAACVGLSAYGIAPRHLRALRMSGDRAAGLLEQVLAASLRSHNPERRDAAVDDLQALAELAQELTQLLFWRALRRVAS